MYLASYIRKLKDARGGFVCPATRASAVYFDDDTTLSKLSFYPVGSIFQSTNSTSPASLFGGSWERIQNRFLYGSGTYSVTATGGEEKHTLTTSEIPSLTTSQSGKNYKTAYIMGRTATGTNVTAERALKAESGSGAANWDWNYYAWNDYHTHKINGGGQSHNNMPPYYCVNIWRRTA